MIHGIVRGSSLVHYLEPRTARLPVRCQAHPQPCYRTFCEMHAPNGRTVDDDVNCLPCIMAASSRSHAERKQPADVELAGKDLVKS